jgi:hypothetical protein
MTTFYPYLTPLIPAQPPPALLADWHKPLAPYRTRYPMPMPSVHDPYYAAQVRHPHPTLLYLPID